MLYQRKQVPAPEELRQIRDLALSGAVGGRAQDRRVDRVATHAPCRSAAAGPAARDAADIAMKALPRHPHFFDAALSAIMSPP